VMKRLKVTGTQMQEMPACCQRIPGKEKASEIKPYLGEWHDNWS